MSNDKEQLSVWYPGHVQKAKRQLKESLKKVDIVLIVLDARAPVATTSFEIKMFKDKNYAFLLNKSDIANPEYNKIWLEEISNYAPAMLLDKNTNRRDIIKFIKTIPSKYDNPRIAVVGVPNVGKSTIINKILGKHKAKTGAQPGITRGVQWVTVEGITVLDSPGILFSEIYSKEIAAKLLLVGSLPAENVSDEIFDYAFGIYSSIANFQGALLEFLEEFGRQRGLLRKGGNVDFEKAKLLFFKDLSEGRFGRLTYDVDVEKLREVLKNG